MTDELSLKEFGKLIGVSVANLCDIEKGRKGVSPKKAPNAAPPRLSAAPTSKAKSPSAVVRGTSERRCHDGGRDGKHRCVGIHRSGGEDERGSYKQRGVAVSGGFQLLSVPQSVPLLRSAFGSHSHCTNLPPSFLETSLFDSTLSHGN
jgi:hypothetical protein